MNIIDKADELGRMISESSELKRFREAEISFLNNKKLQTIYTEYKDLYINYLKNRDTKLEDKINEKYNILIKSQVFNEYLESKKEFETLLSTVKDLIDYHVGYETDNCSSKGCSGCMKKHPCSVK